MKLAFLWISENNLETLDRWDSPQLFTSISN
jgi:hypothetical protein